MNLYDDKEALTFIRQRIPNVAITDEEILDIIEAAYDYYDDHGLLDLDFDEDDDNLNDEVDFKQIAYMLAGDLDYPEATILSVIKAESDYQDSLLQ